MSDASNIVKFSAPPKTVKARHKGVEILLTYDREAQGWQWQFSYAIPQTYKGFYKQEWRAVKKAKEHIDKLKNME